MHVVSLGIRWVGMVLIPICVWLSPDPASCAAPAPVFIGLDADMSSGTAQGGEPIRRGALVAIDKINRAGRVLGRPSRLVVRDHHGMPSRGKDNIDAFASMEALVAVLGGVHTPVALSKLDPIHRHKAIYLGAWAAGTPVVDNGRSPNHVLRVSARDRFARDFLLRAAIARGFKAPGLPLERTGGSFPAQAGTAPRQVDLSFLQTYSFIRPPFPDRAQRFIGSYGGLFPPARTARDVFSPVESAQEYGPLHLLAKAIAKAETVDRASVRNALESGIYHAGLARNYAPAFTPLRHDAPDQTDFTFARFDNGGVIISILE